MISDTNRELPSKHKKIESTLFWEQRRQKMKIDKKILKQKTRSLEEGINHILVIHYSCESFYEVKKGSPTVVSIAIRDYYSGQIITFSLSDNDSEISILEAYFRFLEENRDKLFVHWNMNDTVYGFEAIRNRYHQLTKNHGTIIQNENLFDMDDLIEKKYGKLYAPHQKLYNLANINRYSTMGMRSGKDEADLFKKKGFFENKLSTIRKVHIISNILEDFLANRLLTHNRKFAIIVRRIEENALYKLTAVIVTIATLITVIWTVLRYLIN